MRNYLVYRVGANSANQSMVERMPVGIFRAVNRNAAVGAAIVKGVSKYANQHFEAVPELEADPDDWNAALEEELAQ